MKQFVHSNKIVPFHFWRNLRVFCNWSCEKILSVAYSFKDAWKLQKLTRKKKVKLFHKCSLATIGVAFGVKLVLPSNARNKASWKISNVVVCHICVALIINGNKERGFTDAKIYRKCKFQEVWAELSSEFCFIKLSQNIWDQFTKSSKVWLSMEGLVADSFKSSTSLGDRTQGYFCTQFWYFSFLFLFFSFLIYCFLIMSSFSMILCLNLFGNSWDNLFT